MKPGMTPRKSMMRLLPLLREYGQLERKRVHQGVTPSEYERWRELEQKLGQQISDVSRPAGGERRKHLRVPTRMLVEYRSREDLEEAMISSVSKGGLFISTAFPLEIGAKFVLILAVDAANESVEVPCEVVSLNLDAAMRGRQLGMGVKFVDLGPEQQRAVDALFAEALGHEQLEGLIDG